MGVLGLWQLLQSTGRPVMLESLENQILAVDISIWMNQAVRGVRDRRGIIISDAHLLVLFNRICKLLHYKIKPVFVFDGPAPALKQRLLERRRNLRLAAQNKVEKLAKKWLEVAAKQHLVDQALASSQGSQSPRKSPTKGGKVKIPASLAKASTSAASGDMFALPVITEEEEEDEAAVFDESTDMDSSEEEELAAATRRDLEKMDLHSSDFKSLPPEIRHELLVEMKASRRSHSWKNAHNLPKDSDKFSKFQIHRLLKRNQVQEALDKTAREMNSRRTGAICNKLEAELEDGKTLELDARRIASEDATHYVLLKRKNLPAAKIPVVAEEDEDCKPSTSAVTDEEKAVDAGESPEVEIILPDVVRKLLEKKISPIAAPQLPDLFDADDEEEGVQGRRKRARNDESRRFQKFENAKTLPKISFQVKRESPEPSSSGRTLQTITVVDDDEETDVTCTSIKIMTSDKTLEPAQGTSRYSSSSAIIAGPVTPKKSTKVTPASTPNKVFPIFEPSPKKSTSPGRNLKTPVKAPSLDRKTVSSPLALSKKLPHPDMVNLVSSDSEDDDFVEVIEKDGNDNVEITSTPPSMTVTKVSSSQSEIRESSSQDWAEEDDAEFQAMIEDSFTEKPSSPFAPISVEKTQPLSTLHSTVSTLSSSSQASSSETFHQAFARKLHKVQVPPLSPQRSTAPTLPTSSQFSTAHTLNLPSSSKVNETKFTTRSSAPTLLSSSQASNSEALDESFASELDQMDDLDIFLSVPDSVLSGEVAAREPLETIDLSAEEEGESQQGLSVEELEGLQDHLASQSKSLRSEQKKEERTAASVTEQLRNECQELLRLFGIPYIESPGEAEAQCAYLDSSKQTHGTVTDDSDIWLFGGRKVYKNMFANKFVEYYNSGDIEKQLGLEQDKMIALALLTGSDYTEGIESVGAVRALEILGEFGAQGTESLKKFRTWFDSAKKRRSKGDFRPESKLRSALISLDVPPNFPDNLVVQAYLQPSVDDNKDKFTWGVPALDMLRDYTRKKFGWKQNKCDDILLPIIKRLNLRSTQTHMESFFTVQLKPKEKMFSKRVGRALARIKSSDDLDQAGPSTSQVEKSNRAKKSLNGNSEDLDASVSQVGKPKKGRTLGKGTSDNLDRSTSQPQKPKRARMPQNGNLDESEPSTSIAEKPKRVRNLSPRIPDDREEAGPSTSQPGKPKRGTKAKGALDEKNAESSNGTAAAPNGIKRRTDASDESRCFSQGANKKGKTAEKPRKSAVDVRATSEEF